MKQHEGGEDCIVRASQFVLLAKYYQNEPGGHVACMGEEKNNAYRVFVGKRVGKRPLGITRGR
jgi:hypothetical protein